MAARLSAERLLGDLASLRQASHASACESAAASGEAARLAAQVVGLEGERRALRLEVERLRRRCAELEGANATLSPLLDETQRNLQDAIGRDRMLSVRAVKCQLAASEAENIVIQTKTQMNDKVWQLKRLQTALAAKDEEAAALREEVDGQKSQLRTEKLTRLEADCGDLTARHAQERDARQLAESKVVKLEARIQEYQEALNSAAAREAALSAELDVQSSGRRRLEAVNHRLRLDLQEVVSQAVRGGERPYYIGSSAGALAADGWAESPSAAAGDVAASKLPDARGWPRSPQTPSTRQSPKGDLLDVRQKGLDRIDLLMREPRGL